MHVEIQVSFIVGMVTSRSDACTSKVEVKAGRQSGAMCNSLLRTHQTLLTVPIARNCMNTRLYFYFPILLLLPRLLPTCYFHIASSASIADPTKETPAMLAF